MRIALDYLPAVAHPPGVGRYARELVRALVQLPDRPELDLLELGRDRSLWTAEELGLAPGDARTRRIRVALPRQLIELCAPLGKAADDLSGADLVHQIRLPPLPVRAAPQSIALAELPEHGLRADRQLAGLFARGVGAFVFSSDLERRLRERYDLAAERVRRVPVGCEHWLRALTGVPEPARPARILVLGRRNAARAPRSTLSALELLRARGLDTELVWVEPSGWRAGTDPDELAFRALLDRSPARGHVHLGPAARRGPPDPTRSAARLDEEALPDLVARASVLLHLVADAGTPVTPLEAAVLGVPVVASRLPAFEEVFGSTTEAVRSGAVILCDHERAAQDPGALADALARAIERRTAPETPAVLAAAARPFTWEACARATVAGWSAWLGATR